MGLVIVCAVFTIFMALLAVAGIASALDMSAHGKIASARVVEKKESIKHSTVTVEFTTATGQHVRAKVQDVREKPGTVIKVRYLSDHPESNVEQVGSHSTTLWAVGPAFVTIVSAALTIGLATGLLTVKDKRLVRARRHRVQNWQEGAGTFE